MTKTGRNKLRPVLWLKQAGLCCYCEKPMVRFDEDHRVAMNQFGITSREVENRRATVEHLVRQCEGGRDNADNLALACRRCNVRRKSLDWLTYKSTVLEEAA